MLLVASLLAATAISRVSGILHVAAPTTSCGIPCCISVLLILLAIASSLTLLLTTLLSLFITCYSPRSSLSIWHSRYSVACRRWVIAICVIILLEI